MRLVLFLALVLLAAPAAAQVSLLDTLGGVSATPQICGAAIDRAALKALGARLLPGQAEFSVALFRAHNRISVESRGWNEAQRAAWCRAAIAAAAALGVAR